MNIIQALNAQDALHAGMEELSSHGVRRESRNGPVLVLDGPTSTSYDQPRQRVIFWDQRDANPFFHFYEQLWMAAGRRDVAGVARFVKRMEAFSDDGKTLHGAYGYRWRNHFKVDQLLVIARRLRENKDDRRCVLGMWDVNMDLDFAGKDLPCNTHCYVQVGADGGLDLTVMSRSQDMVWGAYGANVVHFTFLQELLAGMVGIPVGRFTQVTQNMHGYLDTFEPLLEALKHVNGQLHDPYNEGDAVRDERVEPYPIFSTDEQTWFHDLDLFMRDPASVKFREPFFSKVAKPMWFAHEAFRDKADKTMARYDNALEIVANCAASDWRLAGQQWLQRRRAKAQRALDDGVAHE